MPLWRQAAGSCLRRVAQLAGVSTGYDTRLEQGQSPHTSNVVLDAVTRVLQLDETERAYLHTLARPQPRVRTHRRPEQVRPWAQALIDRCGDVLTWNRTAQALLARQLPFGAPYPDRSAAQRGATDRSGRPHGSSMPIVVPSTGAVSDLRLTAVRCPEDTGPGPPRSSEN